MALCEVILLNSCNPEVRIMIWTLLCIAWQILLLCYLLHRGIHDAE